MPDFRFKLKGNTLVCVDWANVYGWQKKLKWRIDVYKLIKYLKTYPKINKIKFYFGTDTTKESQNFILSIKNTEDKIFQVVTKNVKYVPVDAIDSNHNKEIKRRKCDFDVEITRDALNNASDFETFVLMSGDGDYAPLIDDLIKKGKSVVLIFAPGHKGKEYGDFKNGLYLCSVKRIRKYLEK